MRGKFKVPPDPLQVEATLTSVAPSDEYLNKQILHMAGALARQGDPAKQVAAGLIVAQVKQKQFNTAIGQAFLHKFHLFLLGRLTDEADLANTQYGQQPLYDDAEVRAYLESFIIARTRFKIALARLDMTVPVGINQWYLYFKYRVCRADSSEYMKDFEIFERAFDEAGDQGQKINDPQHPWHPRPYPPYDEKKAGGGNDSDDDSDDDRPPPPPKGPKKGPAKPPPPQKGPPPTQQQPPAKGPPPPTGTGDTKQLLIQHSQDLAQERASFGDYIEKQQRQHEGNIAKLHDEHTRQLQAAHNAFLTALQQQLLRAPPQNVAPPPGPAAPPIQPPGNPPNPPAPPDLPPTTPMDETTDETRKRPDTDDLEGERGGKRPATVIDDPPPPPPEDVVFPPSTPVPPPRTLPMDVDNDDHDLYRPGQPQPPPPPAAGATTVVHAAQQPEVYYGPSQQEVENDRRRKAESEAERERHAQELAQKERERAAGAIESERQRRELEQKLEDERRKNAAEADEARRKAAEEAARRQNEHDQLRHALAEADAARLRAEEEARRLAAEAARRQADDELARDNKRRQPKPIRRRPPPTDDSTKLRPNGGEEKVQIAPPATTATDEPTRTTPQAPTAAELEIINEREGARARNKTNRQTADDRARSVPAPSKRAVGDVSSKEKLPPTKKATVVTFEEDATKPPKSPAKGGTKKARSPSPAKTEEEESTKPPSGKKNRRTSPVAREHTPSPMTQKEVQEAVQEQFTAHALRDASIRQLEKREKSARQARRRVDRVFPDVHGASSEKLPIEVLDDIKARVASSLPNTEKTAKTRLVRLYSEALKAAEVARQGIVGEVDAEARHQRIVNHVAAFLRDDKQHDFERPPGGPVTVQKLATPPRKVVRRK